ncbi:MAG: malate dehydrogenase [Candidatus Omnitrophota bacterium]
MTASRIIDTDLADVILVDVVPGMAKGKALDISDTRPISGSSVNIQGSEDIKDIKNSGIVVITAGLARKPGMSRDDLLKKNSEIVKALSSQIKKYCPNAIMIVVTNPLDVMSYLAMKTTDFDPKKVIGMAGVLDSARFINAVSEKNKGFYGEEVFMMGSHGDTMVPINRSKLSEDAFKRSSEIARNRGAEIVKYLGTGSAYFAPSMSVFYMVEAIIKDRKKTVCASAYLDGQYGEKDIYIGVPVVLGSSGAEKVVEIKLTEDEKTAFQKSAQDIRELISKI